MKFSAVATQIQYLVVALPRGIDVKTKAADQTKHLVNSRAVFLHLVEVARAVDAAKVEAYRAERNYEGLEMYVMEKLMGK